MKDEIKKVETIELLNTGAKVNPDQVIVKPVFFMPVKDQYKTLVNDNEPYSDVVKTFLDAYIKGVKNNDAPYINAMNISLSKFMDIVASNINIILNNGIFKIMNNFARTSKGVIIEDLINNTPYMSLNMKEAIKGILCTIDEGTIKFPAAMYEIQTLYASKLSEWLYAYINTALTTNLIDINSYGDYIAIESGIDIKTNIDGTSNIDNSKFALCLNTLLEFANTDIYYIMDVIEVNFVHLFYNYSDIKNQREINMKKYIESMKVKE